MKYLEAVGKETFSPDRREDVTTDMPKIILTYQLHSSSVKHGRLVSTPLQDGSSRLLARDDLCLKDQLPVYRQLVVDGEVGMGNEGQQRRNLHIVPPHEGEDGCLVKIGVHDGGCPDGGF